MPDNVYHDIFYKYKIYPRIHGFEAETNYNGIRNESIATLMIVNV